MRIDARSRSHICCVISISVTYSECVSVALFIQHSKRIHRMYWHLWPVCLYLIFQHYLISEIILGRGGGVNEHKMCVRNTC
jgi:hypothetical protein